MIRSDRLAVAYDASDLEHELAASIDGEVRFDGGSRALYAHDASSTRQVPIAVVVPRHAADVAEVLRICRGCSVPVVARGTGTSLHGECVNQAVVIDFSKYMNRVLEIDVERRRVRVEPGVVLDELRRALAPHGLTFGPDPATHASCTIGGMLGSNACGVHAVMGALAGVGARTSDHVESLDVLTYDGLRLSLGPTSDADLHTLAAAGGRVGAIFGDMLRLRERHGATIRRVAATSRRLAGYQLDELLPERGCHVGRALVGSQSTCALVVQATLAVYPARPYRALVVLGYATIFEAGDHVEQIRTLGAVGLEAIDHRVVEQIKRASNDGALPAGKGWLLVELGADTREGAVAEARALMTLLHREPHPPAMKLIDDPAQIDQIWRAREAAIVPPPPDVYEPFADAVLPLDQLGRYLRELRTLLGNYAVDSTLSGHFGVGCVHARIDFDLSTPAGLDEHRHLTADAAELAARHGGSLAGQLAPELVAACRELKQLWDPDNRMNPGKLVDGPPPSTAIAVSHAGVARCVGIGLCRRPSGGTMCPSFMVTREEKHTTRGRARLLQEMLAGDLIRDGWASEAVKDALDLCIACKGCKSDCPTHVDMATYKAEFLARYHEHHPRPLQAYVLAWVHRWARLGSYAPRLVNALASSPRVRQLLARYAGLAPERELPRFAATPFTRSFEPLVTAGPPVVLWPDTFNNHFSPSVLAAAVEVLEDAGYRVVVPRASVCCGRALVDYGMLDTAKRLWQRTFRILAPAIARGVPIVGLEPSCVAAFRDELPALFPGDDRARRLAHQTHTLAELLRERRYIPPPLRGHVLLHGHCHDKAVLDFASERELLAAMHADVHAPDSGCCGLAGGFGYETQHYPIAMAIGERVLLPTVRAAALDTLLVADGFSCREQIRHGTGRAALHVAELVALALHELRAAPDEVRPDVRVTAVPRTLEH